jgi:hypothetical protein
MGVTVKIPFDYACGEENDCEGGDIAQKTLPVFVASGYWRCLSEVFLNVIIRTAGLSQIDASY